MAAKETTAALLLVTGALTAVAVLLAAAGPRPANPLVSLGRIAAAASFVAGALAVRWAPEGPASLRERLRPWRRGSRRHRVAGSAQLVLVVLALALMAAGLVRS